MEPDDYKSFPGFWDDRHKRKSNLWGYVDAPDVAQSCRRGLEANLMDTFDLIVEDNPNPSDLAYLEDRINSYNVAVTGIVDWYPLAILMRDDGGRVVAGVSGGMWGGYLEVKNLWVREDLRGRGYGRRLLLAAEQQARARGCGQVLLDTHDFQAPEFYKKLGYAVFGVFEGIGGRYNRYYLSKKLTNDENYGTRNPS